MESKEPLVFDFQKLLCTNPPLFDVEHIEFSPSGAFVSLIGARGVSVLQLPHRWGKFAEFEGGKKRISCRYGHLHVYPLHGHFRSEQLLLKAR